MNTCHFGGEIKANSSTDIAWDGGASHKDNSIGTVSYTHLTLPTNREV